MFNRPWEINSFTALQEYMFIYRYPPYSPYEEGCAHLNLCSCWLVGRWRNHNYAHCCNTCTELLPINQPIIQSIKQWIMTRSINQSINPASISLSINQSISQSTNQSINPSITQSINQSINTPINHQSTTQSITLLEFQSILF